VINRPALLELGDLMATYYAHTAEDADGNRLPENSGKWQPLSVHLRSSGERISEFSMQPVFGISASPNSQLEHETIPHPTRNLRSHRDVDATGHWFVAIVACPARKLTEP
jgi:hypothetical protein